MEVRHNCHLTYCTNLHPAETWPETFQALKRHTLPLARQLAPGGSPFGIGLRLSAIAAKQLLADGELAEFKAWLEEHRLYVFTINAFPYGPFHGQAVKENVYRPDWTCPQRLAYTKNCAEILARLLPPGVAGTISTLPGSFKAFQADEPQMFAHLDAAAHHLDALSHTHACSLSLALEPEPLCHIETTAEAVTFFERLRNVASDSDLITRRLGLNYDCCHIAIEYEEAQEALQRLEKARIPVLKVHLSNALRLAPEEPRAIDALRAFAEPTYLHQVVARRQNGGIERFRDLPDALQSLNHDAYAASEWRVHFHIPLYTEPAPPLHSTAEHVKQVLTHYDKGVSSWPHFEIETYTFHVLPRCMQKPLPDHLIEEYLWVMNQLTSHTH